MTVWLKLSEKKDLQLSAVFVVTVFFQGKRSRRDLKFFTCLAGSSNFCDNANMARSGSQLLAEFMWRQRCSAFRTEPLRNLFGEIQAWQNQHPRRPEAPRYRLVLHPTDCRAVDRLFCRISAKHQVTEPASCQGLVLAIDKQNAQILAVRKAQTTMPATSHHLERPFE